MLFQKKYVNLQPLNEDGRVAQLNRASDYGSEGCGFESRRDHQKLPDNYCWAVSFFYDLAYFRKMSIIMHTFVKFGYPKAKKDDL